MIPLAAAATLRAPFWTRGQKATGVPELELGLTVFGVRKLAHGGAPVEPCGHRRRLGGFGISMNPYYAKVSTGAFQVRNNEIWNKDTNNFAPRFGLAWDPFGDGKTSVRAGAGVYYGSMGGNMANGTADRPPFTIRQQFTNVKSFTDPYGNLPGGVEYHVADLVHHVSDAAHWSLYAEPNAFCLEAHVPGLECVYRFARTNFDLGRVIDPLGNPLDGAGPIMTTQRQFVCQASRLSGYSRMRPLSSRAGCCVAVIW